MCLAALFFRVVEEAPIVFGANREEFYARPGLPPQLQDSPVRYLGGSDPHAQGTWLGVNAHGVLAAVTNRRKSTIPVTPRSRGLLVRDALGFKTAMEAVEFATRELDKNAYAGCNLILADSSRAVILHAGDWLRVRPVPPGVHVLANSDVNDESDPRVGHALGWLYRQPYSHAKECLTALQQLCSDSQQDAPRVCLRGPGRGTVSSSLLALRQPLRQSTYLHAQGSPDATPYEDYSALFASLTPSGS